MLYYMRLGWPSRGRRGDRDGVISTRQAQIDGVSRFRLLGGLQSRRANFVLGACRGRGATPKMDRRTRIAPFPNMASSSTRRWTARS